MSMTELKARIAAELDTRRGEVEERLMEIYEELEEE